MSLEAFLKFLVVVLILYLGYQLILKHTPLGKEDTVLGSGSSDTFTNYSPPAMAHVPDNVPMPIVEGPRTVLGSGPSAPSQAAPLNVVREVGPPGAKDPYDEHNEGANAPEKLRHPERMFRPAPQMDAVEAIEDSGIGGPANMATANAMQTFAPEFAQNGGIFMDGIAANDTSIPTNFSSF
jgi:hypothetical protein